MERVHLGFERAKIPHAFGGALALAYYTEPRATIDIDVNVFVPPQQFELVAGALRKIGVDTVPDRSSVIRDGQMRARWAGTPVDVFFSYDQIHEAMKESVRSVPFGAATIPILSPEHLMVAKTAFNRSKDWIDIEQMLIAVDDLDVGEVEQWVGHLMGEHDARAERLRELISELRG